VSLALAMLVPALCGAQDLAPRAYFPTPVSSSAVIVTYAVSDGEVVFDPTLPVTDSTGTIHAAAASYYYAFDFFGRSANVAAVLPFAVGDVSGEVCGEEHAVHRAGAGDSAVRLAVNISGGPARSPLEFAKAGPIRSVLGASLKVVMPTGQYDHTRLINPGTNRWAFKPEFGYARRVFRLIVEGYAGIWLFTANDDFLASDDNSQGDRREQAPIGALEFHVSYDVNPRLWISSDFNYWYGGRVSVNGDKQLLTLQSNSRVGVTASFPVTRRQSLRLSYSDGLLVRFGGKFKTLSVGWQYGWFGLPFRTERDYTRDQHGQRFRGGEVHGPDGERQGGMAHCALHRKGCLLARIVWTEQVTDAESRGADGRDDQIGPQVQIQQRGIERREPEEHDSE
jgi:hypothetical protein